MRICVFPKGDIEAIAGSRTMTIFDWISKASALDIEGLELFSDMFWETTDEHVDRVGEALAEVDFEMPMLCASPDFTNPDAGARRRDIDAHHRYIEIAHRIGGVNPSCRVLSGERHPGVSVEQGLDWAAEAILELLPTARSLGVTLALENHYKDGRWTYPEFAQKKDVYLALLDRIDDRVNFGVQFDPSNAITAGEDSADFLDEVIDRVVAMQASDRYLEAGVTLDSLRESDGTIGYSPQLRHGVIGQGLNDYPRIFRTLVDAGYDGWISIEDGVNGMDEMAQSVGFLRRARDEYFGGSMAVTVASQDAARERAARA